MRAISRSLKIFIEVPYWNKADWNKRTIQPSIPGQTKTQKGPANRAKDINNTLKFICDPDGNPIGGHRAQAITNGAYSFLFHLRNIGRKLPVTWSRQVDALTRLEYYSWMRSQFTELQLCANNWFSEAVVVAIYPQWYRNHGRNAPSADNGETAATSTPPGIDAKLVAEIFAKLRNMNIISHVPKDGATLRPIMIAHRTDPNSSTEQSEQILEEPEVIDDGDINLDNAPFRIESEPPRNNDSEERAPKRPHMDLDDADSPNRASARARRCP